jgi:hypothetical protein
VKSAFHPLRTLTEGFNIPVPWKVVPMIYDSASLYLLVLIAHFAVFVIVPVVLFRAGWPTLAGIVMVISTLLPIAGQTWLTDSEMPGAALLLMFEAPVALIVLVAGLAVSIRRWRRGRGEKAQHT